MDFLKDFLRKYSSLLLPISIAVAAVVLLIPTMITSSSVKQKVKESEQVNDRIQRLINEAVPQNQWKLEAEYQDEFAQDANTVINMAKQTSMRPLLSYDIFPEPTVASNQIFKIFGSKYTAALDRLANEVMNSGDAPSQTVLSNLTSRSGGTRTNTDNAEDPAQKIIDTACLEKARQVSVYANPETSLIGYDFWKDYVFTNKDDAVEDCWYAQIAYWIQEDVAESIAAINTGSSSVLTSKVKRLLGISFSNAVIIVSGSQTTGKSDDSFDRPSYVLADEEVGLAPIWTGRKCNEDIDVIHFAVAVIIDVRDEPKFYEQLCGGKKHIFKGWKDANEPAEYVRNQITVLEHSLTPINIKAAEHQNYRYGNTAVAKLNLVCEYVFNRGGYDEIKPEKIKAAISQTQGSNN